MRIFKLFKEEAKPPDNGLQEQGVGKANCPELTNDIAATMKNTGSLRINA